jgi:alcohol dehydrogenase class IV
MTNESPTLSANWSYPTNVRFGVGRIKELGKACAAEGMKRPLLVTDPGLANLPMIPEAIENLTAAGLSGAVFSDVQGNPISANVTAGIEAYKSSNHDGIIAWGGGSAMDCAKVIALMIGQERPMWDFEDIGSNWKQANPDGIATIIAVPTTSGTGSEVGRAGVITDERTHTKKIIFHPKLMPAVVICDPELIAGLPANITAWTGMDALAHCLEAYCSPFYHPMGEGIAVEGLRLVKEWLPTAVADGSNLTARAHMMSAAAMGAVAFQKGLGAIHSLSHPVGSIFNSHHGLTNAVFMPYVLKHNRSAIDDKLARLARWLDIGNSFDDVQNWIIDLRTEFSIPHTAAELGVDGTRLDELAKMAAEDPTAGGNPVFVGEAEMRKMYDDSMSGKL